MKSLALDFERRELVMEERDAPRRGDGEIGLRVVEVGVCATDRELAKFRFGAPPEGETRLVIGHEAVCEVEEEMGGFSRGEYVVPMLRRPCGAGCASCRRGRADLCLTGEYKERGIAGLHGYFAERAVDAAEHLVRVPRELAEVAALVEPLSVVEKAVERSLAAHAGEPRTALVVGAGPVGMLAALSLVQRGLEVNVVSLEAADHPRAKWVRRAGAEYGGDSRADLVFEASGNRGGAEMALARMRELSVLTLIGAPEGALELDALEMLVKNQAVVGVVNAGRAHFEMALRRLAQSDRGLLTSMMERRGVERWRESFAGTGDVGKIVHRF